VSFEFQQKQKNLTMRISETLLNEIKREAERKGMPYQRFIRQTLENAIQQKMAG
jgi:predicted DNA binding CopG/RHH family protein